MKRCTACGETKPLDHFGKNKRASQGVNNWCRICYNAYGAKYYALTRDRRRSQARERRLVHREARVARGRAWREANPDYFRDLYQKKKETIRKRTREKYWANRKEEIAKATAYAKQHPHVVNAINARRHAKKLAAPGNGISKDEWAYVMSSTAGLCTYCGKKAKLTLDHITPLSEGGAHDVDNAVPVCKSCNCAKRDQPLLLWLARRAA